MDAIQNVTGSGVNHRLVGDSKSLYDGLRDKMGKSNFSSKMILENGMKEAGGRSLKAIENAQKKLEKNLEKADGGPNKPQTTENEQWKLGLEKKKLQQEKAKAFSQQHEINSVIRDNDESVQNEGVNKKRFKDVMNEGNLIVM
jgi:hypothetical protein